MSKQSTKRWPLLAAAMTAALVLVPSSLAGQPVTQTLTPPPPQGYACMAVGSGAICQRTFMEITGPEGDGARLWQRR